MRRFQTPSELNKKAGFAMRCLASSMLMVQYAHAVSDQAPDAGVSIDNVAMASYVDDQSQPQKSVSNLVQVAVGVLYAIDLSSAPQQTVEAGATVTWLNTLTNQSNTGAHVQLSAQPVNGLSQIRLFIDQNNNGLLDATDLQVTQPLQLARGQSLHLIVTAQTAASLSEGQALAVPLQAVVQEDASAQDQEQDGLLIVAPRLTAIKRVDQTRIDAVGANTVQLNYELDIQNASLSTIRGQALLVDGQPLSAVLVRDPLPPNTHLVSIQPQDPTAVVLYALANGQYSRTPVSPVSQINEVLIAYPGDMPSQSRQLARLVVAVNAGVQSAQLNNTFTVQYRSGISINPRSQDSNTVSTEVAGKASIDTRDPQYQQSLHTGSVKKPLYIEVAAASCNVDRTQADQVWLEITSSKTGDVVRIRATETEPNSGRYRISLPTDEGIKNLSDAVLQTLRGDQVNVALSACVDPVTQQPTSPFQQISTEVYIDPYGVVFNSATNQPVAGARLTLVDGSGQPATGIRDVYGNALGAVLVTDAQGQYSYPQVLPGSYRLQVDPASIGDLTFPSQKTPAELPQWRVDAQGSYGQGFVLGGSTATPVAFDVPLDPPKAMAALTIQKQASAREAELGDFVDYTVTVNNPGNADANQVQMNDHLPHGFVYVPGSMRVNGVQVPDPQGGKGPYLKLGLGVLQSKTTLKVQYRVYIGPNGLSGDGINRVTASGQSQGQAISSLEASAQVRVRAGALMNDALVIGKVYADCNRNGMQDTGERGIPGVRLFLEDGSFVVTDREGKYDFYGLKAKTHVLKLDRSSLPANVQLIEQGNRNAGDPGSRFVDLRHGELHRADFAVTDGLETCSVALQQQIDQRRKLIGEQNTDLERAIKADLVMDPNYSLGDVRAMPASGCVNGASDMDCALTLPTDQKTATPAPRVNRITSTPLLDLEQVLKQASDTRLEVLNLQDQQVLPFAQTNLQVRAMAGTQVRVRVNGEVVDDSRIGKRAVLPAHRVAGYDYIGLNLREGPNRIEVEQLDALGNVRESRQLTVVAPGQLNQVLVSLPSTPAVADGKSLMHVVVKLVDSQQVPVAARTAVTLDANLGRILLDDLDPTVPGVQQFVEGGELLVPIQTPPKEGEGQLLVESGLYKVARPLRFVPELRPMVAAGVVEGTLSLKHFKPSQLSRVTQDDGFEEELNELSQSADGQRRVGGRAAFFLKGKVKGSYLLTMAYDSDKGRNERLFRDIRPDEYYPVYGDAAAKGFDAQSTGKLYVRLDKGRSSVLYGDFNTRIDNDPGLMLGQYNRSLTGARGHYENDRTQVTAFVAQTRSRQLVSELPALGISGPYPLAQVPSTAILQNSEKVEVITRDRNNPGRIIPGGIRTLARFSDYQIDTLTNTLYLTQPVSSQDGDGNPQYLRISVEAEEAGDSYLVGGVAGRHQLRPSLSVGGSYVQSDDPLTEEKLASVNAVTLLNERTKLVTEVARSSNLVSPFNNPAVPVGTEQSGNAARIELNYATAKGEGRIYHQQADTGFLNNSSPISPGRQESGAKAQLRTGLGLVRLEGSRTEDQSNGGVRDGLLASVERPLSARTTLELGARYYREGSNPATASSATAGTPYEGTTVRAKLRAQLPRLTGAEGFVEFEQDLQHSERQLLALGGNYQISPKARLYARHEMLSSLDSQFGLNSSTQRNATLVGVESNYMKDGSLFSEYRIRDGLSAREAEAALGLRNRWMVREGLRLSTSFEKIKSLSGQNTSNESTAASIGVEYLQNPDWKATGRLEKRWSDSGDTLLNALGFAYKLNDDLTLLVKNIYNLSESSQSGDRLQDRFQIGMAYRDFDNTRLDGLAKLEYRLDDNQAFADPIKSSAYIASMHVNYHPARRLTLSGQYAAKYRIQQMSGLESRGVTQLLAGRALYDLNERWDAGLNVGTLWSNQSAGQRHLLGAEVGYLVAANLWVSAGYNFIRYQDDDLVDADTTQKGAYVRVRFKFDEDLFNRGQSRINASLEPQP